ncbi:hypothetical protein BBM1340_02105 [Bifidobacterium breve MCC 1340]|nr:hypothetical protein BBM1340_02105 [Bifidobacterium breve MCC 1340]
MDAVGTSGHLMTGQLVGYAEKTNELNGGVRIIA